MQVSIIFFIILIPTILTLNPPLWPERFSQAMMIDFGDLITTGKFWYDSTFDAQRYDFANGNSKTGCGAIHPMNTPCSYLTVKKQMYMIYPEKNLCCKISDNSDIISREWLYNYSFVGYEEINKETFETWSQNLNNDNNIKYYCDRSQRKIPRRQLTGKRVFMDYWPNSYSENYIDSKVFNLPQNCTKYCYDRMYMDINDQQSDMGDKQKMREERLRMFRMTVGWGVKGWKG